MKVLSVVGARPQLVKLAPVAAAATAAGVEHVIVHTGQHYDANMSDVFFSGLGIPDPDHHLGIGSGSHGAQTGAMLTSLDPLIDEVRPDWVLVYGDTNSTVAAALAAVKLHVPVAHLEAGLRSFNRRMPEEHNRVLTDHAADLLLAPTEVAMAHLASENLAARSVLVGDVMVDVCLQVRDRVLADGGLPAGLPAGIDPAEPYVVCTLHRPDNTDDRDQLAGIVEALAGLPIPVALLAHPRLVAKAAEHGLALERGSLRVGEPLPYAALVAAVLGSVGVVTDSGGLQKEAFLLDRVTTTIRPETEWVETLEDGWNMLVPDPAKHSADEFAALVLRDRPTQSRRMPYGDGRAAHAAVRALLEWVPPGR
ncbi:MAG: UDP-N-acetylglucosamine 2-epimerase (non-hydrolyzing) [Nocardioides sp.]